MLMIVMSAALFGFIFCLSPGAVLAETLRRGLQGGFRPALYVQLGSLIGDALWALLGLAGISILLMEPAIRTPLAVVCAIYLTWLGFRSMYEAWRLPAPTDEASPQTAGAFLTGALISLTNPKNIVYWGALGSALAGIVGDTPGTGQLAAFFGGFMAASVTSCFISAGLAAWLGRTVSPRGHRISHGVCGVALLVLALLALNGR
ncbi:chemosensory pili system protein ChpE [Pseudomonas duriflava]|uniref:Chemosensory pili system protein ChpE n=1 Tax=Pseudomonas duriflava TaxID=459528 RepID=A0A562QE36_9PSED|nr:LysE family transporter [Pseudomonas duriflava]TWI54969.1 chemosensory pili system protein ChpE [Pseudomonas duriflava]